MKVFLKYLNSNIEIHKFYSAEEIKEFIII